MTNAAHTPGPWTAYNTANSPENRFMVGKSFTDGFQRIADCSYEATNGASGEEALANARLIAAAPQLLKALADLMPEIESEIDQRQHSGDDEYWHKLDRLAAEARAAIAKATGAL